MAIQMQQNEISRILGGGMGGYANQLFDQGAFEDEMNWGYPEDTDAYQGLGDQFDVEEDVPWYETTTGYAAISLLLVCVGAGVLRSQWKSIMNRLPAKNKLKKEFKKRFRRNVNEEEEKKSDFNERFLNKDNSEGGGNASEHAQHLRFQTSSDAEKGSSSLPSGHNDQAKGAGSDNQIPEGQVSAISGPQYTQKAPEGASVANFAGKLGQLFQSRKEALDKKLALEEQTSDYKELVGDLKESD
mmetsp:Transcript_7377/g.12461  ORF Transcript_7377/g.12461 Transcript_7377/m.12461 type:complete len:243 (-) Transcript_7377:451-1179(-)